jgi:Bacteriocin-protection, YdeI or OmpD-Associated/Domain of unknown function (DUF1905)
MSPFGGVARAMTRVPLPPAFDRLRITLSPGVTRLTDAGDWSDCLVLVERGTVEVECEGGSRRSFAAGDLLALECLPLRALRNRGSDEAGLVAVRRHAAKGGAPVKFSTTIVLGGKTATGFQVPDTVVDSLGAGKRPAVTVRIGDHTYRSTVAVMDGVFMLPLSAENREAAGVAAGDEVEVEVALDTAPRVIAVPDDFAAALDADPVARRTFDGLSYSLQRFHVESVTGAKSDETRQRRIAKSVATLREGRAR